MANKKDIKCDKSCKNCKYPCVYNGENLKPITADELQDLGFVLCEEYTDKDI